MSDILNENLISNQEMPQWTILCPFLFIEYIKNFLHINCKRSMSGFTDDTAIIVDDIYINNINYKIINILCVI